MSRKPYTNQEYLEMVLCYREVGENYLKAEKLYYERFGKKIYAKTIANAIYRHRETGSFEIRFESAGNMHSVVTEEGVLRYVEENPMSSASEVAKLFGVSKAYVLKLLKDEGCHAYHFSKGPDYSKEDYVTRIRFCKWYLEESRNILWTDEYIFTNKKRFDVHKSHYWSTSNPKVAKNDYFNDKLFNVTVWAGMLGDRLFGPMFLEKLDCTTYLDLLCNEVEDMLDTVPLDVWGSLYFQHNRSPVHNAQPIQEYLTERYGDCWIGRKGPIEWPAKSQDLTPLSFHLWERVKDIVYGKTGREIESQTVLRKKIRAAFKEVREDRNTLSKVQKQIKRRAKACLELKGKYVTKTKVR